MVYGSLSTSGYSTWFEWLPPLVYYSRPPTYNNHNYMIFNSQKFLVKIYAVVYTNDFPFDYDSNVLIIIIN